MVVGIGGFRDIGDPNDPRRRRGAAPQSVNVPGLPAPTSAIIPGASPLANQVLNEVLNDPDAPRIVRPEIIEAPRREGSGRRTRLGQKIENAKTSTGFDPRRRREETQIGKLIAEGEGIEVMRDPRMRRGVGRFDTSPAVDAAQFTRSPADNAQGPNVPTIYKDFLLGLPRETGTTEKGVDQTLYYGLTTSDDPTKGSLSGKKPVDYVPYGSVMVPKVQRTGQYVAPKGPNRGEMEYSTMYPGDVVLSRDTDLDNVYTSGQFEELGLGELAQELEYKYTTPLMGESGLVQAAQEGRFIDIADLPPEEVAPYLDKKGNPGTFVGKLAVVDARASAKTGTTVTTLEPVFIAKDKAGGDQLTTARTVPDQTDVFNQVVTGREPLYRIGLPTKYDSDKIDEELRPFLPGREVGVAKKGARANVGIGLVQQAAQKGAKFFLPAESPGESPIPAPMEAIDGTRKLLMLRPDGSETMLFPRVDNQGNPIGTYRVDDAYQKRYEGPGVMNTYKPAQIGAGREETQLNYYDQSDNRVLGEEGAVSHTSFLEQLKKGVRMLQPDTADAYKGVIAPMLLRGEITMEQLEAEVPAMRPGTVARQMLDQAVTELAVQSERAAPQFAPSTLETEAVRGDVIDPERAVTEGDAYDAGLTMSRSELEGVPTTEREQRMNDRVLAALGIQDSGAIGLRPSEMAPAQAAYVADVMRRNRSEGSAERLDFQKRGVDSIYTEYPALAAELAREARRNPGEGGRVTKGDLMGGPVRVVQEGTGERIGSAVDRETAGFARALRDYYQGQAQGLPYAQDREDDPITYREVAANIGSQDPDVQEQAMRDMTGIIRARQEMGQNVDQRPEMGEYLNAPSGQVQRAPSLRERARQAAMRLGLL